MIDESGNEEADIHPQPDVPGGSSPSSLDHATNSSNEENDLERLTYYPGLRRSSRQRSVPERFEPGMIAMLSQLGNDDAYTHLSYSEAMNSADCAEWKAAMDEEIGSINKNSWRLVPLPGNAKPVRSKWVYLNKRDSSGNISRRKARLVAKGFTQKDGVDYNEIFSPVAKYTTVMFMLAYACQNNLSIIQIDVKTTFLNAELEECIFMEQSEGFVDK